MKITCGTDIVEIKRIKNAVEKSPSFTDRIFTCIELDYCNAKKAGRFQSLAARFAAKEAVAKALGTGFGEKAAHNEIEIKNDDAGKPMAILYGKTLETFLALGGNKIDISLSHGKDYAVAFAVMTYMEEPNE